MTATQKLQQMLASAKAANPTMVADQGTRKARRLYVGNFPATYLPTEQVLVDFFNAAVVQVNYSLFHLTFHQLMWLCLW